MVTIQLVPVCRADRRYLCSRGRPPHRVTGGGVAAAGAMICAEYLLLARIARAVAAGAAPRLAHGRCAWPGDRRCLYYSRRLKSGIYGLKV